MPRRYISSQALCPFYRGEGGAEVYCEGPRRGTTIRLLIGSEVRQIKDGWCRSDWASCPIARMLWALHDDGPIP